MNCLFDCLFLCRIRSGSCGLRGAHGFLDEADEFAGVEGVGKASLDVLRGKTRIGKIGIQKQKDRDLVLPGRFYKLLYRDPGKVLIENYQVKFLLIQKCQDLGAIKGGGDLAERVG